MAAGGASSASVVENDDARADKSCAPTKNPASLDFLGDGGEAQTVVECLGDPALSLGDIAEMNATMMIGHSVNVGSIAPFAHELEWLARCDVFVDIVPTIDPGG